MIAAPLDTPVALPLVYLHIPKTAGTSTRVYLERHFRADEVASLYPPRRAALLRAVYADSLVRRPPAQLAGKRLVIGHFDYDTCRRFAPTGYVFTILREPQARAVSNYFQLRRDRRPDEGWETTFELARSLDLAGFLAATGDPDSPAANRQTRFLAGQATHLGPPGPGEPSLERRLDGALGKEHVQLARERLDSMAFVGLSERLDDSLLMLAAQFGWRPPRTSPRLNVTASGPGSNRAALPAEALAALERSNRLDQEVYRHASALFERRWKAFLAERAPGLPEPEAAAAARRVLDATLDVPRPARLPRHVVTRANDVGFGDGWHGAEPHENVGLFRWTAEDPAEVTLWVTRWMRQPVRILVVHAPPGGLAGTRLRVDGAPTPAAPVQRPDGAWMLEATLPARLDGGRRAPTRLDLFSPEWFTPGRSDAGGDERRLGLGVASIEVGVPSSQSLPRRVLRRAARMGRRVMRRPQAR